MAVSGLADTDSMDRPAAAAGDWQDAEDDDRPILVVGRGDLAQALEATLGTAGAEVLRLRAPTDRELRTAVRSDFRAVILVSRDDIEALRMALLVEHLRPGLRLIVTMFGRTVASQLARAVPDCRVISMADAAAPSLVAACLKPGSCLMTVDAAGRQITVEDGVAGPTVETLRRERGRSRRARLRRWMQSQLRPLDSGSSMLVVGSLGLAVVFVIDVLIAVLMLDASFVESFYGAVKTIATIGPNELVDDGPDWFKAMSSLAILVAGLCAVLFTAGLVNRLLEPRLSGIVGSLTIPRSEHVVVVGLGQVGLRLCLALRDLGVPVVAVEVDPRAPNVRVARDRRVPVVIGHGGSRFLLGRLSIRRARALAAVTSSDGTNVSVAVAGLSANDDIRVVLRAGDGDVTAETQSLFRIGAARDVLRLAAVHLSAVALGQSVAAAFVSNGRDHVLDERGNVVPFPPTETEAGVVVSRVQGQLICTKTDGGRTATLRVDEALAPELAPGRRVRVSFDPAGRLVAIAPQSPARGGGSRQVGRVASNG